MPARLNPYISFNGNAREALEFYQSVFGGKLNLDTFKENNMSQDPADDDKIMHGMIVTDSGLTLMASDTPAGMEYTPGAVISISLSGDGDAEAELRGYYEKLSDGGMVTLPLEKAPWGDMFGMCNDKFGISWMVNIAGQAPSDDVPADE